MVYGNTAYFTERLNVNGSDITPDNIEQLKTVSNHVIQKLYCLPLNHYLILA